MNYTKIHIILNEHASSGNAKVRAKKMYRLLNNKNIYYTVDITKSIHDGIRLGKLYGDSLKEKYQTLLMVIGGDGTLNECLNGLKTSKNPMTPILYIPSGSGNDFARGLNLETNIDTIINNLNSDTTIQNVDVGLFTDNINNQSKYFVNNIGVGFDAEIVHSTNKSSSKKILNNLHLGKLSYISQLVKVLIKKSPFNIKVTELQDNNELFFKNVFLVTTTNHPYFGGGVPIAPNANVFDNNLELVIVEDMNIYNIVKLFIKMLKNGSHLNNPKVHIIKSTSFNLITDSPQYKQMDGEDFEKSGIDLTFHLDKHPFIVIKK